MNRRWLSFCLFISLLLHLFVLTLFYFNPSLWEDPWGGGLSGSKSALTETIWVEVSAGSSEIPPLEEAKKDPDTGPKTAPVRREVQKHSAQLSNDAKSAVPGGGEGASPTPAGGQGEGIDASSVSKDPGILKKIRQRILARRQYPAAARAQGLEGVVQVLFEIDANGFLKSAGVVKSSGSPILDEAALATLKKAEPYPLYSGPIRLALTFALEENVW